MTSPAAIATLIRQHQSRVDAVTRTIQQADDPNSITEARLVTFGKSIRSDIQCDGKTIATVFTAIES